MGAQSGGTWSRMTLCAGRPPHGYDKEESTMNQQQLTRMEHDKGFIAALDQSGGSTPKALKAYGIDESAYHAHAHHQEPRIRQEQDSCRHSL